MKSITICQSNDLKINLLKDAAMRQAGTGGANTKTGLDFENKVDFQTLLAKEAGYEIELYPSGAGQQVLFEKKLVARCFKKYDFYRYLAECQIDWKQILSKKLLPDDALLVIVRKTLFIIEIKYQQVAGSVDEKLQTCDFKRKQYEKLVKRLDLKVEYVYILNDWFRKPEYRDVLEYIESVNCSYHFNNLPLEKLGLPKSRAAVAPDMTDL